MVQKAKCDISCIRCYEIIIETRKYAPLMLLGFQVFIKEIRKMEARRFYNFKMESNLIFKNKEAE